MKTFTRITFQSGHIFEVLTSVIADNRTAYYTMADPGRTPAQHAAETASMFSSDFEVFEWAKGNMNWDDLAKNARMVGFKAPDFSREWGDAELESADTQTRVDMTTMGEGSLSAPIELALSQCAAEDRDCMALAFTDDANHLRSAVVVLTGGPEVVGGYIAAIQQFDDFMTSQKQAQPATGH